MLLCEVERGSNLVKFDLILVLLILVGLGWFLVFPEIQSIFIDFNSFVVDWVEQFHN